MTRSRLSVALITTWVAFACAPHSPAGPNAQATEPASFAKLRDELRVRGLDVREADVIQQSFFTPPARVLVVNGEDVQVYVYADGESAEGEATRVSADGMTIGTAKVHWIAQPHFYRRDNIVVIHLGANAAVAKGLSELFGPPFAGP